MNMKLSYRDKVVFIVVIVILILVAGFFLLIKPKFEEIDTAKYNLENAQAEKDSIDAKIATLPALIEDMKTAAKEIGEKQGIFMEEQHPYLNEMYIRDALSSVNPRYTAVSTTYTTAGAINRYTVGKRNILAYENKMIADLYEELPQEVYDEYNRVAPPSYPGSVIGVTTMSLTFENDANYRTAYNVINRLAQDEKAIIVNSIGFNEEAEQMSCALTLYSINPLNVEKVLEETDEVKPLETPAE